MVNKDRIRVQVKLMKKELRSIIKKSTFHIVKGIFVYAKVSKATNLDKCFMISKDEDEITIVTQKDNLETKCLVERNKDDYSLIALNVSVPFYSVGFLAAVSNAIADQGMNILIISTYSKDYVLVKYESLERVKKTLLKLGFKQK